MTILPKANVDRKIHGYETSVRLETCKACKNAIQIINVEVKLFTNCAPNSIQNINFQILLGISVAESKELEYIIANNHIET